jgi:hypothetical protein
MQAGRIVAVKNASNYDNNSDQNQRVMRPQRGPEHAGRSYLDPSAQDPRHFQLIPRVIAPLVEQLARC